MAKKKKTYDHELNVNYGKTLVVGIPDVKINLTIDEGSLDPSVAHELLYMTQLDVRLTCDPNAKSDAEGQSKLIDTDVVLEAVCDSKSYSCGNGKWRFAFRIPLDGVDQTQLGKFKGCSGNLELTKTGSATPDPNGELIEDD